MSLHRVSPAATSSANSMHGRRRRPTFHTIFCMGVVGDLCFDHVLCAAAGSDLIWTYFAPTSAAHPEAYSLAIRRLFSYFRRFGGSCLVGGVAFTRNRPLLLEPGLRSDVGISKSVISFGCFVSEGAEERRNGIRLAAPCRRGQIHARRKIDLAAAACEAAHAHRPTLEVAATMVAYLPARSHAGRRPQPIRDTLWGKFILWATVYGVRFAGHRPADFRATSPMTAGLLRPHHWCNRRAPGLRQRCTTSTAEQASRDTYLDAVRDFQGGDVQWNGFRYAPLHCRVSLSTRIPFWPGRTSPSRPRASVVRGPMRPQMRNCWPSRSGSIRLPCGLSTTSTRGN